MSEGRKTQNLVIDYLVQKRKKMITGGGGRCDGAGHLAEDGAHLITSTTASKTLSVQLKCFCPSIAGNATCFHFLH